jgi:hypothetical protein
MLLPPLQSRAMPIEAVGTITIRAALVHLFEGAGRKYQRGAPSRCPGDRLLACEFPPECPKRFGKLTTGPRPANLKIKRPFRLPIASRVRDGVAGHGDERLIQFRKPFFARAFVLRNQVPLASSVLGRRRSHPRLMPALETRTPVDVATTPMKGRASSNERTADARLKMSKSSVNQP